MCNDRLQNISQRLLCGKRRILRSLMPIMNTLRIYYKLKTKKTYCKLKKEKIILQTYPKNSRFQLIILSVRLLL